MTNRPTFRTPISPCRSLAPNFSQRKWWGAGYINEYPVERFYRDARLLRLYEGTTQIQQIIVGRELLRESMVH
jgi:hypothetical protein